MQLTEYRKKRGTFNDPFSFNEFSTRVKITPRFGKLPQFLKKKKHHDEVECLVCGKSYLALTSHLSAKHGYTIPMYKKEFGKNTAIFGDDLKKDMTKIAKSNAVSDFLIKGRKRYWDNPANIEKQRVGTAKHAKEFWGNPKNKKKQKEILEKLVKPQKDKFAYYERQTKLCAFCKKEFSPRKTFTSDGYLRHRDVGRRWKEKKYCSNKCKWAASEGKPKSEEHRKNLAISKYKISGIDISKAVWMGNGFGFPFKCRTCGETIYVKHHFLKKRAYGLSCKSKLK